MEQELLFDLTDSYLKFVIADASGSLHPDFDSFAAFGELGINSFQILKIIKKLEADFGILPKSLLFENFNIHDLAKYFMAKHEKTLSVRFAAQLQTVANGMVEDRQSCVSLAEVPQKDTQDCLSSTSSAPILILEKDAWADPELNAIVTSLYEQYKLEGCVSRGTRIIAPSLFIGSEKRGYFNFSRSKDVVLVYSYTGPRQYLPTLLEEILRYCTSKGLQLNLLADEQIEAIGSTRMTTTPFGALQRVSGLQQFTLDGGPMRRLRYQVQKFQKTGPCRSREYIVGSEPETDQDIVQVIDQWCSGRTVVNPLVHVVRAEILAGKLIGDHRLFLTYLEEKLQNVILISKLCDEANGYLMDLEFYPASMPLGGLEFAIVQIIETLRAEGCDLLSMGGTHGCKLEESPNADPELDKILDELRAQNIVNDAGNLQFKNKFRPENRTIFLCRPAGSGNPHNVIDIIMMIADPDLAQTAEPVSDAAVVEAAPPQAAAVSGVPDIEGNGRSGVLAHHGFNPLNIPNAAVEFDLKTDSWAQLEMPVIEAQMRHLHEQIQQPIRVDDALRTVFPFAHIVLTESGQAAEHVFFKACPRKGVVVQNLLFPSTIFHQIDNGFSPREVPSPAIFQLHSNEPYKGDLSWEALQEAVTNDPASIAMVCIEVGNNAAGGHPVSMQHLRNVKALLAPHSIPLVIDATRVMENAQFLAELDPELAGKSMWVVAREILSCADTVIGSLTKDFCVNKGGIVATNDAKLFGSLQQILREEGSNIDVLDKRSIALSMQNRRHIEGRVKARMEGVRRIWQALHERNVPVVQPAGGHCVLIDVSQLPEFRNFNDPVASFLAWLYLETGIRAGAHSVGMQKHTAINATVRLAIPVGLKRTEIDVVIERLVAAFEAKANIPEIVVESKSPQPFGDVHANYRLLRYHNVSAGAAPSGADERRPEEAAAPQAKAPIVNGPVRPVDVPPQVSGENEIHANPRPRRTQDVAIVGMAGRYPKAKNLRELWANLVAGRDCIEEMPADRYERRVQYGSLERYRGGFIDDVDRFDSLFFNISPREAEMLDPQERLFLEVAWEALEDAGYYPELLAQESASRNIGVYVGAVWAMYQILGVEETRLGNKAIPNSFLWSIANRASYALNLSGPSLTVDTACSSSLTALYLAVEAIQAGECSGAIVGGVNLDLHQTKFDINNQGGALSSDGYCRTFGKGANGYVQGEGIGALFLKPLHQSEKDGDHIYGVIRGAVVNHGGRTSGYTVPNPKAQGELIKAALEKVHVDAASIGYIEAHGTGTELGDPIEITGLNNAFQSYAVGNQSCAIGSVKTNIGHLEAAAGVVSVSKVLLQMQHRQLVPSLHSTELNEFIDFANSPFYVVQELEEWKAREVNGERLPLRAGISSFGAGGANAYVILDQYVPARNESVARPGTLIFPLSARNEDQLRDAASHLAGFLRQNDVDLNDTAFTLQQGRKSFEHRLAIVARTKEELIEKLVLFVAGKKGDGIGAGHAKSGEAVTRLLNRREKQEFLRMLVQGADAQKTAALWTEGLLSDWQGYPLQGRRVSLPTYPFADKRHWVSTPQTVRRAITTSAAGVHPMIDRNESTFERQIFRKTFHERDFFIYDHRVSDIPTLPGVAYLEFARKAGELATGRPVRKIKNVLWISPIAVQPGQPKDALIELKPSGEGVQFEVFSEENGKKTPHSQGKLYFANGSVEDETIDLAAIRARCAKVTDGPTVYPLFKSFGLNLGPSFQVLQEVWKSDSETLGALHLPQFRQDDLQSMPLHPSLLDGSLQAGVAAQLGSPTGEMVVPFSIGEVEILHPLQPNCFSYVTQGTQEERKGKSSGVIKSNVTIVDETGRVLVRIRESVGVPLREVHKAPAADTDGFEKLYYSYDWQKAPVTVDETKTIGPVVVFGVDDSLRDLSDRVVMVHPGDAFASLGNDTYTVNPQNRGDFTQLLQALNVPAENIVFAWPLQRDTLELSLDRGIYSFFYLSQALVELKLEGKAQLLYVHAGEAQHEAATGFVNSLRFESPKLLVKTLDVRGGKVADAVATELRFRAQDANAVRYEAGQRSVRKLQSFSFGETAAAAPIRTNGVYVITGGAGGLGLIFAQYLAKQHKAKVVLTGRSILSAERETKLRELGADVVYIAADVSNRDDVRRLIDETKARFGAVNGVIHAAGVLRDSLLRNKTREEMSAVFAPKVYGTLHLDELTQNEDLDFFVTFSSLAAVAGNGGQCDYSYANHFMDSFVAQREQRRAEGKRTGRAISFNWSIWADGGMKLDQQTEQIFIKTAGIKPLGAEMGIDAFVRGLATERVQIAVLEGLQEKVETMWGLRKKEPVAAAAAAPAASVSSAGGDLIEWLQKELTQIVVELLKVDASDVEQDKVLLDLGFDSIGLTTFANAVNDKFGLDITPVLFFDYPSVAEVAKYLSSERESEIRPHFGGGSSSAAPAAVVTTGAPVIEFKKGWTPSESPRAATGEGFAPEQRFINEPIAVVGMSGVMPQSADLEEFWENLRTSTDMITVIPEDRWKWEEYYGDPLKEANKSNSKWGGFMKEVDKFDPLFFGISPREAQMMDPQQRIFLQTVWKAIEDSGQKVSDLSGTKTGLFVGVATNDYADLLREREVALDGYTASGNSHSVLANRVSFLLNLRGPSAPIDTACSSSLVALHRAIESIHTRSCDMAVVGGVQVMLSPAAYISFGAAGMLSSDGKCKTFDKKANGYVRGEGSGAIFLKRLSDAERDGNHIYAIVKATAENHGGKVTTLTAPNSAAQTELLIEAYEKAQVDPATVGYIECHGTGTPLGDPIEIQALSKAFAELYKKRNKTVQNAHCGLSSVKTNIGHLETAAGIAGLLKALLAIQHKQIPANIHFEEINPYINLKGTPFYIADKLTPWEAPVVNGAPAPRRAGLSSFGFGGANAHIVLEEYIPAKRVTPANTNEPQLIVLSAKNEDRLIAYAHSLRGYLDRRPVELIDLAYTLQVGRDEMAERLAVVAANIEDLKAKLDAILRGETPADTFRNNVNRKGAAPVSSDAPLGAQWVAGAKIDWRGLCASGLPRRISVPTYPFARERYWVPAGDAKKSATKAIAAVQQLHPLVQRNTSTLQEQKFSSRFSGEEFYLADHVVETHRILPGVAYIEMARAAGELSGNAQVSVIRNLVFERPLVVEGNGTDVEVSLTPAENEIRFAVKSGAGTHCTGKIGYQPVAGEPEVLDIAAIRARCTEEVLTGSRLYPALNEGGLKLGRSFQIVQNICATESESLAVLRLPEHLADDASQFWLHPALMDGSLHTAMGLVIKGGMDDSLALPYSVGEVQIFHPLADLHYGYATWSGDPKANPNFRKVDFHLLDKDGKVLVRIKDFVSRTLQTSAPKQERAKSELQSFVPSLVPASIGRVSVEESTSIALLGGDEQQFHWLRASYLNSRTIDLARLGDCYFDQLLWIAPEASADRLIEQQEEGVIAVFRAVKALLDAGYANKKLQWTLVVRGTQSPAHASVVGLVGSLAKEYPQWDLRLVDVESLASVTARECLTLPYDKQGNALVRRQGAWLREELTPMNELPASSSVYRENGVYVVIGGAGGVGEVWSRFMIENYGANIVWIGRRELDATIQQKIGALAKIGSAPLYVAADATDAASLERARKTILETYPAIHGVVHSAIVLKDQSLARMDEAMFRAGLSAKVDVSVNMDRVFGSLELDFVLFFSSIVSFFKTPGQANYAAGCTFKDAFARSLQQQRAYAVKTMNWGYWGSVGVVADEEHNKRMAQVGLGSIEPEEGMAALQQLAGSSLSQAALIKTVGKAVAAPKAAPAAKTATPAVPQNEQRVRDHVRRLIAETMSDAVQIEVGRIGGDTPFSELGVDSIAGIRFLRLINEALQIELEATSLFEFSTVEQLTGHILQNWGPQIAAQIAPAEVAAAPTVVTTPAPVVASRFAEAPVITRSEAETQSGLTFEPIAVIGMSGRFAESESLHEFWQNLAGGKHLVSKVSRWSTSDCVMSEGKPYCSHGSFIDSIDRFDPAFFGLSSAEAVYMDPQQRLFLEESWKALEDAGYAGKGAQEKQCGVYVGCGSSNYDNLLTEEVPAEAFWGNSQAVIPARIAYHLDLQGPAIAVDTACSSSLVTIHLACQGLWARETEMALAGGVFLQATPEFYQVANQAGMLSPNGRTRSFDAHADGFVPGEGVGVVVLKRLSDALRDGDYIHGVISGSGINQDGRSNGFIAPNGRAQERLERAVYERFRINPETIQVVEAHATGSVLGDSIEYGAITRSFRQYTDKTQFCALGTVKTNIGHAAAAAGVASLLKLLLALKHQQIPPSLHFEQASPVIDLASGPFYVNTELKAWEANGRAPRRAAINSFGFSGTNAHLVLEEAPARRQPTSELPAYLIVLSARSAEQLQQQAQNLLDHVKRTPDVSMSDLSFSLFSGRMHFTHRLACAVRNAEELVRALEQGQVNTGEIPQGRVREQAALKKFGNYCIRECRDTSDAAVYAENVTAIAELYVQGYALEYDALSAPDAKRIPLPTYPFADERYWIDADGEIIAPSNEIVAALPAVVQSSGAENLEDELAQIARTILGVEDELALDKVLLDLGFDSVGLTQLADAINAKYQLALTPVIFFDYPSLAALANYLTAAGKVAERRTGFNPSGRVEARPASVAVSKPSRTPRKRRSTKNDLIAIVGISGVLPQSPDLDAFWQNLKDAKDLVTVIPRDRWNWEQHFGDPFKEPNKTNSKWGGFIGDIDKFDPLFFGISPREAQMMDPQQRLFLEAVWKAVENSGQKVSDLAGTKTGVFVGVSGSDYTEVLRSVSTAIDGYSASGNVHSILANRVSFLLDLHGPSEPIDTACSSSLIALHRAVESIHSGSCDMAIAGGVQINLVPGPYIAFSSAGMLSTDGKCKTFDKSANGYVRGEGVGAIFLKRLSDAERDGNPIYAIVKSTAENHGGRVSTLTAPNSAAQSALLIDAYQKADIDPATVGYIECHGTGTSLGDPIEAQALSTAFAELYRRRNRVPAAAHTGLASVKTNIGHLEAAAGVAGVFKVLLAMQHRQLPANVHFEQLNPYINFENTPFYVVDKLTPWTSPEGTPRRAGVSSFGFGGANAHVVLEEYVAPARMTKPADEPRLIVLSAKNAERLDAYVASMNAWLAKNDVDLADFAYTLQAGRDEMPERLAFVASSVAELKQKFATLDGVVRGNVKKKVRNAEPTNERDLTKLAELWVSGAKIDSSSLYTNGTPRRRIAAPTYPFARERHWPVIDVMPQPAEGMRLQSWVPVWKRASVDTTALAASRVLVVGNDIEWARQSYPSAELLQLDAIESELGDRDFDHLLWIADDTDNVLSLFRTTKALLRCGYAGKNLQWTVVTTLTQLTSDDDVVRPANGSVSGFMGSLAKEYPQWDVRVIDVDALSSVTARECLGAPADKQGNVLARRGEAWFRQELQRIDALTEEAPLYRKNGVYVVIGGAGGIGEVWTRSMIERHQANVVWIGRRAADATIEKKIAALAKLGPAPLYVQADATSFQSLQQAFEIIRRTHPAIHGVVHSAVVLREQSIGRIEESEFRAGYAAKADVSVNLDRVFGAQELDFMLFFSSMASFFKTPGVAAYSAGCTFKDSFAQSLQQQRAYPVKTMNWGYWGSIGVAADEAQKQLMAQMGVGSIEAEEALASLQALVGSRVPQVLLIKMYETAATAGMSLSQAMAYHVAEKMRSRKSGGQAILPVAPREQAGRDAVRQLILTKLAETLRMDAASIPTDASFPEFGVDSIAGVTLVRTLNEELNVEIEPSKLFQCDTVDLLSQYIAETWQRVPIASTSESHPAAADVLDDVLWHDAALAEDFEKVTF